MVSGEVARVQPFDQADARIGGKCCRELPVPDVDGAHMGGAALQQHLREAAGRSADIERVAAARVEAEMVEAGDQFQRGARNIAPRRVVDLDRR